MWQGMRSTGGEGFPLPSCRCALSDGQKCGSCISVQLRRPWKLWQGRVPNQTHPYRLLACTYKRYRCPLKLLEPLKSKAIFDQVDL
jgi:hypothetical protein